MRIEVTDQAVFLTDLDEEDQRFLEHLFRRSAGRSLIIPRRHSVPEDLGEEGALEALISSMRTSAQETYAALRRRGYRIVRGVPSEG